MSLATTERIYAGHEQCDAAALTANGIFYRCYVWLSRVEWRVEAAVFRVQQNGTEVEVFRNVIEAATSGEISATNGVPLDCPKIIAVGTTFVVHWMQCTTIVAQVRQWSLYRATMDMTAFDITTWDNRGAVSLLETHQLYDVAPVIGSDTDFVVGRVTDTDEFTLARYDDFDWVDTVWIVIESTDELVAPRVFGVYAHDADNDAVVSYQYVDAAGGGLWSQRYDADTGTNGTSAVLTFTSFNATAGEGSLFTQWVQVGHCRTASHRVAVVAEAQAAIASEFSNDIPSLAWIDHVVYREIDSTDASRVGNEHWAANYSMHSRPWSYASGTSTTSPRLDVYVMLTFRSVIFAKEWSQALALACNLDYPMWNTVASGAGLRPRPIGTIQGNSIGIPDARTSGWKPQNVPPDAVHTRGPVKRMNHLSSPSAAPPFGPDVKTRTVPLVFFNALRTTSDLDDTDQDGNVDDVVSNTGPEGAGVVGIPVYMEDPWTVYRDVTDPDQPVDNFSSFYPRSMHQTVPWGRGLFVAGGTPQLYDGSQMVEAGFLHKPEVLGYQTGTNGTMEVGPGSRYYYFCYEWTDRQGTVHRSAPSEPVQVSFGMSDNSVRFAVRCTMCSLKDATAFYPLTGSINIVPYRTELGGTNFYRLYGATDTGTTFDQRPRDTPVNDPTVFLGYVDIDDGDVTDAMLREQGPAPYLFDADGAFVEPLPQPWPACHTVALHQNRIVAADSLDPTRLIYSDENNPDVGAATYAAPVVGSNQWIRTGEIHETTGLQSKDNLLIQFTRGPIISISVQDAEFGQLSWSTQILHESLGCVDPKSVVLYPLGIGFQALKGYYTLAASGEAAYGVLARSRDQPQSVSGAAVEDDLREAGNVRAASHDPSRNRLSLVCNGRPIVTRTVVLTLAGSQTNGVWAIEGLSETIEYTANDTQLLSVVADGLAAVVQALLDADDAWNGFGLQVASVTSPGSSVRLVLQPDVLIDVTGDGPGATTFTAAYTDNIETQPWVLDYYYDFQQWTKAELVQSNASPRLSEAVDGCYWQGNGGARHVVLTQGGVLIQRLSTDENAYADQTGSALVGIPVDLETSWIHLGGISGYMRVRSLGIQTERYSDGAMHVDLQFDRDGSLNGESILPQTLDWTSPAPAYLRVRPREQKVSSMKIRIYEDSGVAQENTVGVVAITFDVGVLPGMRRVADAQVGS